MELRCKNQTAMSQGTIPSDILMTLQMPGIKEYDIGFRSGAINAINNLFWKENLEKEEKK